MLNHESVAKPLGIGLNMLVDPFLCPWCQWAEQEHGAFITHQYIGRSFSFDFHVISFAGPFHLPHLPEWATTVERCFVLGWRGCRVGTPLLMPIRD